MQGMAEYNCSKLVVVIYEMNPGIRIFDHSRLVASRIRTLWQIKYADRRLLRYMGEMQVEFSERFDIDHSVRIRLVSAKCSC